MGEGPDDPEERRGSGTQSIARAFLVMRLVATGRNAGLALSEVARLAGLSRPTVHRILAALIVEGVVEQKPKSRRYALGDEVQLLALSRTSRSPLVRLAEPRLVEAAAAIGDTLFLTLRTGLDTICVGRRFGASPIQVPVLDIGDRRPLGISSAGIAILAGLPAELATAILTENALRMRSHGIAEDAALAAVQVARRLGHAYRSAGLVPGTRAVSVAIRGGAGEPLGAVTVAAISRRLMPGRVEAVLEVLKASAASFEAALARDR